MPSDTGTTMDAVLDRLRPALDPFRSAVAEAAEEVRLYRARHEEAAADPVGRMVKELGPFAAGRIDPLRLTGLQRASGALDPLTDRLMAVAYERFVAADSGGVGSYRLSVAEGADLRDAVKDALAEVGRAFGTAHAVEKAREKRFDPDRDHTLLHPHPFHRWTPAERALAPPLVVEVAGSGLRGSGLLEFMEGVQKFVLLVRGSAPPAPLARLASPGVFVAQVQGAEGLDAIGRLAAHDGPGVVGIFEDGAGALLFSHAPDGELQVDEVELKAASERAETTAGKPGLLDLRYLAGLAAVASVRAAAVSGLSAVDADDVALGGAPALDGHGIGDTRAGEAAVAGSPSVDLAVDQLADWLLARTHPSTD